MTTGWPLLRAMAAIHASTMLGRLPRRMADATMPAFVHADHFLYQARSLQDCTKCFLAARVVWGLIPWIRCKSFLDALGGPNFLFITWLKDSPFCVPLTSNSHERNDGVAGAGVQTYFQGFLMENRRAEDMDMQEGLLGFIE